MGEGVELAKASFADSYTLSCTWKLNMGLVESATDKQLVPAALLRIGLGSEQQTKGNTILAGVWRERNGNRGNKWLVAAS